MKPVEQAAKEYQDACDAREVAQRAREHAAAVLEAAENRLREQAEFVDQARQKLLTLARKGAQ